jgi:hypothetical protein
MGRRRRVGGPEAQQRARRGVQAGLVQLAVVDAEDGARVGKTNHLIAHDVDQPLLHQAVNNARLVTSPRQRLAAEVGTLGNLA